MRSPGAETPAAPGPADGQSPVLPKGCQMAKFDPFLSLDCARVEGVGGQSKERKGLNFAAQRSGAIVQESRSPKGQTHMILKIRL